MQGSDLESLIAEFEEVFDIRDKSRIDEFAARFLGDQEKVIEELIHTELELRLKSGDSVRVEHYLKLYPQLATNTNFIADLVRTEYRVRARYETGLSVGEYVVRFPDCYECLFDLPSIKMAMGVTSQNNFVGYSESDESSRFRRINLAKQGGLGNIWLADDRELGRPVAVKEIKDKFANSKEHQERFVNEAIITGSLEHPSIVPVYGMGKFNSGFPYYAMQMVEGKSLQVAIQEFHEKDHSGETKNLEFRRLLQHVLNLCSAIQFAHDQGVLHRDIKPSNLMIGVLGQTLVVDWGLATVIEPESFPAFDQLNSIPEDEGNIVGSPAFMSPEQAAGNTEKLSRYSDVYSLGATLLSVVTGVTNPNSTVRENSVSQTKPSAKDAPRELQPLISICAMAMSHEPSDRYESARAVAEDVERFLADEPVKAHPESSYQWLSRVGKKHRGIVQTAALALFAIACISTVSALMIYMALQAANAEKAKVVAILEDTRLGFTFFEALFSGPGACGLQDDLTLLQGLDKLKSQLNLMPERVQLMMHHVFALNYAGAGRSEEAIAEFDKVIKLAEEHYPPNSFSLVESKAEKAIMFQKSGQSDIAKKLAMPVLRICESDPEKFKEIHYRLLSAVTMLELNSDNFELAAQYLDQSNSIARELFDNESDSHRLKLQAMKVQILRRKKDFAGATELIDRLLVIAKDSGQEDSLINSELLTEKARIQRVIAENAPADVKLADILTNYEKALKIIRQLHSPNHFGAKVIELEIAIARYRHPQATLADLDSSVKSLDMLYAFFSKTFPESKGIIRAAYNHARLAKNRARLNKRK